MRYRQGKPLGGGELSGRALRRWATKAARGRYAGVGAVQRVSGLTADGRAPAGKAKRRGRWSGTRES
jgi:hypothetical protein